MIETTPQNEDSVQKITELLKFYGIIQRDNILESYHWVQYDVPQLQDNELAKIEEDLGPYVGVLSTHTQVAIKLERWWSSLKETWTIGNNQNKCYYQIIKLTLISWFSKTLPKQMLLTLSFMVF